jgi:hypothetical protein
MLRTKFLASILLTLIIAAAQISSAFAAPAQQAPTPTPTPTATAPITGTIQSITLQTDSTGVTTVTVTLTDGTTVNLSLDTAFNLGLVTTNDPATAAVVDSMIGQTIEINPTDVITPPVDDTAQNPVAAALADFFGLQYQFIQDYHDEGVGYGVIAQACWLSFAAGGDASQCGEIIDAKQNGEDFTVTTAEGTIITASSWGQFKKAILDKHDPLQTLGAIMSGRAKSEETVSGDEATTETDASTPGGGNGQGNGNGNDNDGNGKGHGKGKHGKGHN